MFGPQPISVKYNLLDKAGVRTFLEVVVNEFTQVCIQ